MTDAPFPPAPAALAPGPRRPRSFAVTLLAGNLLLTGLLWILAALVLSSSLAAHRQLAYASVDNVTVGLAGRLEAELRQADLALLGARQELRRLPPARRAEPEAVRAVLESHRELVPALESLRLTDEHGIVRWGNDLPQPVDLSVRAFYAQARDDAVAGLVVSEPLRSRVSGNWVVALARRVEDPNGRFAGVVYATLPTQHLRAMLAGVDLGAGGALTIRHGPTLALVSRRAGEGGADGTGSTNVSGALRAALAAEPQQGHFVSATALDGVRRVSAYRRLPHLPFLVLAGQSEEQTLAPWRRQLVQTVALTALLTLLLAAGSFVIHRDRLTRQGLLARLEDSAARVQDLYDQAPCGYHSLDADGRIQHINRTAASWLDATPDALRGRWLGDYLLPDDRARLAQKLARARAEGAVSGMQFDLVVPGRPRRRVRVDVTADRDAAGHLLLTRSVWHDITQQHDAEQRAARLLREQAAILDSDLAGIVKLRDATGQWNNPALEHMFGLTPGALHGQSWRMLFTDDAQFEALHAAAEPQLRAGSTYRTELQMRHRDGRLLMIDLVGTLLADDEALWMLHDVSEPRRQQAEVERALREARDTAETASRLKAQFLANMSHEIRTPMNGIIGMTGHALEGPLEPAQRENLEIVQSSASSLLGLLDDLLDFSKIEAGRLDLECVAFDLRARLDVALRPFARLAADKGLAFELSVDARVPQRVAGDPTRIAQVVVNLVSNAVKFTATGRVGCRIDCAPEGSGGLRLSCSVEDTGPGIPVDARERLFEPFVQADGTITRRHGGTGLGLAICHGLVTRMDGTIEIGSRSGGGTRIAFTAALQAAPDAVATAPGEAAASAADGEPLDILVVEDHPVNSLLAERVLTKRGHRVTLAADGAQAVALVARRRFDLVLMDLQMPVMDGVTAMREIRALQARDGGTRRTPIVALTANALKGERERLLDLGMDGFLAKPFTPRELAAVVERHGSRAPAGAVT